MTLQKLRRWLGFPLEDRYRVHIEQDIVQSSLMLYEKFPEQK